MDYPDVAAYKRWARIADTVDDAAIAAAVDAVNTYVARECTLLDPDEESPPDVVYGCLLLVNRLLARRNSPEGVVGSIDGVVADIGRYDPDVARLLDPYTGAKLA
jgi:hypothetical protein